MPTNNDAKKVGRPKKHNKMVPHTVYLTPEQKSWVNANAQFNLSGFVRLKLDKRIDDEVFLLDR